MRSLTIAIVSATFFISAGGLSSQTTPVKPAPVPAAASGPAADPIALLKQMKADNAILLERQDVLLKALDVLAEEARQARIFAKRG